MNWDELPALFPVFPEPGRWLPRLQLHLSLLQAAAAKTRVTAVAPEDAVRRHFAESLEIWRIAAGLFATPPSLVVDVGSGGGFPGLVIACVAPGSAFHLVEPLQKRARLLAELAEALALDNVTVHPARAEDAARGPLRDAAGLVTARAVAPLRELLEYTAPFAAAAGLLVLPKGSGVSDELAAAYDAATELACRHRASTPMRPEVSSLLSVIVFEKLAPTPARYPRRAGVPSRKPL